SLVVTIQYKVNGSGTMTNNAVSITPYANGSYGSATTVAGFSSTSKTTKSITISSGLTNCTGFKLAYSTKQNGNLGVYSVSWTATYSSTDPVVAWDGSYHPSEGYTGVTYSYAAISTNITDPSWTWSVSPSTGVTIEDADEMADIAFANAGTYTVTAYAEASADASKHAQVTQEIVVAESASALSLSASSVKLGLSKSTTVTPTVVNTGSYTDSQVAVSAISGSDLITITGLTEGKVDSGNAVTITSKTTEGSATVRFSNNGNNKDLVVEITDSKTIIYAFTTNALEYSSTGSDSVDAYTSASWDADVTANSYESSGSARGIQWGSAKGDVNVTLGATSSMKDYSITKVDMVVSSNGTGNTIGLSVGDATFKSGNNTTISTNSLTNSAVSFAGNGCGDLVIAISDTNKSVYIKSVILTIELNTSVVTKFVNNYLKMDQYGGDTMYNESRCTENWAAASAAYEKLNSTQKALFVGGDYASAVERFGWWATANGATFNSETGALSAASNVLPFVSASGSYDYALPTILIVGTVVVTASALIVIRKRRSED
ncbi:MAG: hypothetical protein IJS52_05175, partial [Bacilli bacterium]|nr:hypothetical protein [Bacilli bacterium]